jgi:hypothetical protein
LAASPTPLCAPSPRFLGPEGGVPVAAAATPAGGLLGAVFGCRGAGGWPFPGPRWWPPPPVVPGAGNCAWGVRSCSACGGTAGELRARRPLFAGEALLLDAPVPSFALWCDVPTYLVTFDGSGCPGGQAGSGAILWGPPALNGSRPQVCVRSRRLDGEDSLAAEAHGFLLAADILRGRQPCPILVVGDNPRIMQFLSSWGRFRSPVLQPLLLHTLSSLLLAGWQPQFLRVPRALNRDADVLARGARRCP